MVTSMGIDCKSLEEKRKEILAVLDYRCGEFFVGSMEKHHVSTLLGIGHYTGDIVDTVKIANRHVIDIVHKELIKYIDYMRRNPISKCWCCGSVVRKVSLLKKIKNFIMKGGRVWYEEG